ncbi:hypothetical protein [Fulvivirga sp.]|uniref:hypothetical protein n=1 Tax=Fulvivirga sp. TaxID=1931237 RepID=UPI0032EE0648
MSNLWLVTDDTSTEMLVKLFRNLSAPQSEREKAFIYLTYRFREDVLKKCEILCRRFKHDVSTAEMIADKTFESFARNGAFDESKGNGKNYDESFLLYLLTISENELISYYREIQRKANSPYNGSEEIIYALDYISPENLKKLSLKVRIGYEIVSQLSADKRAIFLTYNTHQRPGFKMPRKLLDALRLELNLKQNTINAYLKGVRDSIDQSIKAYEIVENFNEDEE